MDFEGLDPQNGCSRIDGVRFVQKGHVHENVCKMNENGNSNGTQKGALRQFVRHRLLIAFVMPFYLVLAPKLAPKCTRCAVSFKSHFLWFPPTDKKRANREPEGTPKGG